MGNCLVTKLKAEVNNPNLPYLETMQQFTLDAIAASGNATMTDAQKLALNHFFYQLGAIDNSALWQKIKYLALPMICNDVVAKALVNYVDNTVNESAEGSFDTHGFICELQNIGTTRYSGASNGLGLVTLCTKATSNFSNVGIGGIRDSENGGAFSITKNQDTTYAISIQGLLDPPRFAGNFTGASVLAAQSLITYHVIINGNVVTSDYSRSPRENVNITNKPCFLSGKTLPIGVSICGLDFTVDEAKNLLLYSMKLKEAFVS